MRRPLRRPKFSFNIPSVYLRAVDLYNRGDYQNALPLFRQACDEKPDYADFLFALARCLVMLHDDHAALLELSETLRLNPYYVDALLEVAFILARQGDTSQARGYFAEALRFFRYGTSDSEKIHERREQCAHYFEEGLAFCQAGNLEQAGEAFSLASNLKPDEITFRYNEGVIAYGEGDLDQARALLESVIEGDPYFLDAYHVLGQIALSQGREEEAIDLYKRALSVRDDYPDSYAGLGEACLVAGRVDEAVSALEKALSYNPRFSEAYFYLGRAYLAQGRLVEAKRALEELVRHRPSDGLAYLSLGEVLENLGQSAEAYVAYERAASCPESMELARRRLAEMSAGE
jgi:tetratricopeptide (TPR) repeat protein